jgi:preprotein translocase subunit SecD
MNKNIMTLTVIAVLFFLTACQQPLPHNSVQSTSAVRPTSSETQQQAPVVGFRLAQSQAKSGLNPLKLNDGTLYFSPTPVLTRSDLAEVTPMRSKQGQAFINIRFTPDGAKKLASVSRQNMGKWFVFTVNDQLVGIPKITQLINNGELNLTMANEQQAINVANAIIGKAH